MPRLFIWQQRFRQLHPMFAGILVPGAPCTLPCRGAARTPDHPLAYHQALRLPHAPAHY